ncbi:MAG: YceD family protein [Solirubrobacteraceae bacterium]
MPARADDFDLAGLGLSSGEGRRRELTARIAPVTLAGERFAAAPADVDVVLDVSRTTGSGYALRLRFTTAIAGPCMRCLGDAAPIVRVDAREVHQPGGGDDLESPYLTGEVLDLAAWARDAFLLAAPDQILCRPDCRGLCPECAVNLNEAEPGHHHDRPPDPRWAKLRDLGLTSD